MTVFTRIFHHDLKHHSKKKKNSLDQLEKNHPYKTLYIYISYIQYMYTINTIYQVPFQLPLPTFRSRLLGFGQDTQASATHATPIENTQLQFPCIVAPEIGLKNRGDRGSYDVCVFFSRSDVLFWSFLKGGRGAQRGNNKNLQEISYYNVDLLQ